jgi:hypothetical protein
MLRDSYRKRATTPPGVCLAYQTKRERVMSNLKEWIEDRQKNGDDGTGFDESISWSELAQLTHTTQVERFGFCTCEDNEGQENPYADCPKGGE